MAKMMSNRAGSGKSLKVLNSLYFGLSGPNCHTLEWFCEEDEN